MFTIGDIHLKSPSSRVLGVLVGLRVHDTFSDTEDGSEIERRCDTRRWECVCFSRALGKRRVTVKEGTVTRSMNRHVILVIPRNFYEHRPTVGVSITKVTKPLTGPQPYKISKIIRRFELLLTLSR